MCPSNGPKDRSEDQSNDSALWQRVKDTITPLKDHITPKPATIPHTTTQKHSVNPPHRNTPKTPIVPKIKGKTIDGRTQARLKRGKIQIDLTLDLHGHTQATAQRLLTSSLIQAYSAKKRLVLVITGKGERSGQGTGVLKRALPTWCALSPLNDMILSITPAAAQHGGGGAFYIYLRRQR